MPATDPRDIVRRYWTAMNGNDWDAVARTCLAEGFQGLWPQSAEVIAGRGQFSRVNGAFPGQGGWRFEVLSLLADGDRVVTDTRVTQADLGITARALTFHDCADGLILRQTEFWPDPFPIPEWRRGMLAADPHRAPF